MSKALAILKTDLGLPSFFSGLFTETDYHNLLVGRKEPKRHPLMLQCHLLDRPACEDDLRYLQLLPYAALRTRRNGRTFIAIYKRGKKGAEPGLHGKWSIGFGGHVDTVPAPGETIVGHLAAELQRELREELNLAIHVDRLHVLVSNTPYLYLTDTKVDQVHLGMPVVIDVSETVKLESAEPEQICNLRWADTDEVQAMAMAGKFEEWSRVMVEDELV